jgi:hypothetical protein
MGWPLDGKGEGDTASPEAGDQGWRGGYGDDEHGMDEGGQVGDGGGHD